MIFWESLEKLKSVPRHCVTSDRLWKMWLPHSWRLALMAFLLKDELGEINIDRVIRMCIVHDLGEAVTGDIPTFEKTGEHEEIEKLAVDGLLRGLPGPFAYREELHAMFERNKRCRQKPGSIRR